MLRCLSFFRLLIFSREWKKIGCYRWEMKFGKKIIGIWPMLRKGRKMTTKREVAMCNADAIHYHATLRCGVAAAREPSRWPSDDLVKCVCLYLLMCTSVKMRWNVLCIWVNTAWTHTHCSRVCAISQHTYTFLTPNLDKYFTFIVVFEFGQKFHLSTEFTSVC